ncbi:lithostathine-1-beta-like [Oryzias melastigma]|uniref:lithostathine-1-beta-like n=1 Tax=Oryzias melastigma TaxID=30732 RepID=UPI00168D34BA|nr:lithostathine-1-beta-like [Oryzias melastigma]
MEALKAKPNSSIVWIGLYREPWTWSDGSLSSFRNWLPSGLNNNKNNEHCALENPQHQWADGFCDLPYVFVCQQVPKTERKTTLRMKFNTDADLTDPKVKAQILEQLQSLLSSGGRTDIKLQWKIEPKK